jgi:hypothetical protein
MENLGGGAMRAENNRLSTLFHVTTSILYITLSRTLIVIVSLKEAQFKSEMPLVLPEEGSIWKRDSVGMTHFWSHCHDRGFGSLASLLYCPSLYCMLTNDWLSVR